MKLRQSFYEMNFPKKDRKRKSVNLSDTWTSSEPVTVVEPSTVSFQDSVPSPPMQLQIRSKRRRRGNRSASFDLNEDKVTSLYLKKRSLTRCAKQYGSVLPIFEELPSDWDMLTFKIVMPTNIIKDLIHLTVFYSTQEFIPTIDMSMYLQYMDVKLIRDLQERAVAKNLMVLLKKTIEKLDSKILLPLRRDMDRSKLFYYRSGKNISLQPNVLQPIILQSITVMKPVWNIAFNLFNGYTLPYYYPYKYIATKTHRPTVGNAAMLEYFMIPALTSQEVRNNIKEFLHETPSNERDIMVTQIIECIKMVCTLPIFTTDDDLWNVFSKFVISQKSDLDSMSNIVESMCAYPPIWEQPHVYANGVRSVNAQVPWNILKEFLTNIFFSCRNEGNQFDTSLLEASFFFYVIYSVIRFSDPMDCTFIIECTNAQVLSDFYLRMRPILNPFNTKLNTRASLFMVRHNMKSIVDSNFGSVNENMKHAQECKRTAVGFAHVTRHTITNPKTSNRGNKKSFVFHLTNFWETGQDELFASRFLQPQIFIDVMSTLISIYSDTNVEDITDTRLHMWSKQCLSEVLNSIRIFTRIMPSSNNCVATADNNEIQKPQTSAAAIQVSTDDPENPVFQDVQNRINQLAESTDPWGGCDEDMGWTPSTMENVAASSNSKFVYACVYEFV